MATTVSKWCSKCEKHVQIHGYPNHTPGLYRMTCGCKCDRITLKEVHFL